MVKEKFENHDQPTDDEIAEAIDVLENQEELKLFNEEAE